jgi:peptidoglycan biosynthesis protein MviN/MurJ (putative lipid II flippase)
MFESTAMRDTVAIVSLSALGLLAGMMLGIFIVGYAARGLPEESWTRRFQMSSP